MSEPNWAELRRQFPMLETWTYLDTARKAPLPLCVEQATRDFFKDVNENAGDEVWNPASVEKTRAVMARLLGAPREIGGGRDHGPQRAARPVRRD